MEMEKKTCGVELQRNNMGSSGEEEGAAATSQLHVLAVDDSIADRKIIERLLNVSAFKVTTVESATRALEFLGLDEEHGSANTDRQRIKVNMIITDYSMPGMTGYELLKKIKKSSALKETPVVIMSSENVRTRIYRCLEEGAEEFIVKPVKLSDVNRLKCHIVKGLSKEHQNPTSAKRKRMSDNLANLPEQPLERRPRLEEQAVF